jgi:exonuclease SbcD
MKFLHVSDLHIGKVVNAFPMIEDQEYALGQILAFIAEHRPDAVLIAGDIYDKLTPPPEAVRVFDRFLTRLAATGAAVIIVSGNHDSPERLGFASGIMSENNVYIYGVFDGKMRVVTVKDEYGEVRFHMLPYIRPADVRRFYGEEVCDSYESAVAAVIGAAGIDKSARNVLIAHQFFAPEGSDPERSDSERETIGGTDRIGAEACGASEFFDYAALGHLHGPQRAGSEYIRYSGSPLKYSFSERNHNKCALLVDMRAKGDVAVTALPIKPLRDMRRIRGALGDLLRAAGGGDNGAGKDADQDYLHVILTDADEVFDALGKLRAVYPNIMQLDYERFGSVVESLIINEAEFEKKTPAEMFDEFFVSQNGDEMSGEQRKAVIALLDLDLDFD